MWMHEPFTRFTPLILFLLAKGNGLETRFLRGRHRTTILRRRDAYFHSKLARGERFRLALSIFCNVKRKPRLHP